MCNVKKNSIKSFLQRRLRVGLHKNVGLTWQPGRFWINFIFHCSGSDRFYNSLAFQVQVDWESSKSVLAHVQISLIYGRPHCSVFFSVIPSFFFLQKTSFSVVKSRLALGSPGWLVVHSVECHHAKNGLIHRQIIVDFPLVITSICDTIFKTRPDQK